MPSGDAANDMSNKMVTSEAIAHVEELGQSWKTGDTRPLDSGTTGGGPELIF